MGEMSHKEKYTVEKRHNVRIFFGKLNTLRYFNLQSECSASDGISVNSKRNWVKLGAHSTIVSISAADSLGDLYITNFLKVKPKQGRHSISACP